MDYCSLIVGDHTVVTVVGVIDGGRVAGPNLESAVVELPRSIEPIVPRIERDRQPRIVLIEVFGIGINQTALFGVILSTEAFALSRISTINVPMLSSSLSQAVNPASSDRQRTNVASVFIG